MCRATRTRRALAAHTTRTASNTARQVIQLFQTLVLTQAASTQFVQCFVWSLAMQSCWHICCRCKQNRLQCNALANSVGLHAWPMMSCAGTAAGASCVMLALIPLQQWHTWLVLFMKTTAVNHAGVDDAKGSAQVHVPSQMGPDRARSSTGPCGGLRHS